MTLVYLYDHYNHASSAVNQKCLICLSLSYIYILCIKFVVGGRLMMARKKTRKHLALCKRPLGMKYVRTLTILLEFFFFLMKSACNLVLHTTGFCRDHSTQHGWAFILSPPSDHTIMLIMQLQVCNSCLFNNANKNKNKSLSLI